MKQRDRKPGRKPLVPRPPALFPGPFYFAVNMRRKSVNLIS